MGNIRPRHSAYRGETSADEPATRPIGGDGRNGADDLRETGHRHTASGINRHCRTGRWADLIEGAAEVKGVPQGDHCIDDSIGDVDVLANTSVRRRRRRGSDGNVYFRVVCAGNTSQTGDLESRRVIAPAAISVGGGGSRLSDLFAVAKVEDVGTDGPTSAKRDGRSRSIEVDGQRRIAGRWVGRERRHRRIRPHGRIGTGVVALDCVALKCVGCADVDRGSVACGTSTSPYVARDEGELPSRREGGHCKSQVARDVLKTEG